MKGVIPNESPSSWPMAALRAQAVAARSFALTRQVGGNGFDLYDDTRSQVYEGIASETARDQPRRRPRPGARSSSTAARSPQTFFSACSGGHTESVENVFFGPPVPYLVGVPDPYDHYCPLHTWTLRFSGPEISAELGAYLDGQPAASRRSPSAASRRGSSGRSLYGSGGVTKIRGDQLAVGARRLRPLDDLPQGRRLGAGTPGGRRRRDGRVPGRSSTA